MKLNKVETKCVKYLREWFAEGAPKRLDGSFPTDFLTVMRVLGEVPDSISGRRLEEALLAGIELNHEFSEHPELRHRQWTYEQIQQFKRSVKEA